MAITINGSTNTIAGLAVGGLPNGVVDADTLASGTRGIQIADTWRLNTDVEGKIDITSGWERDDTDGNGLLGTGMTESSGIFSFPSTGYWLVSCTMQLRIHTGDSRWSAHYIVYTADNGSNWSNATRGISNYIDTGDGNASHNDTHSEKIFDITDISNQKIKINIGGTDSDVISQGDTNNTESCIRFLKLGDT